LSVTVNVASLAPEAPGVKVTLIMQVPRAFSVPEDGQVVAVESVKSDAFVPLITMDLIFRDSVGFVSVKVEVIAALVEPTLTDPKFKEDGSSVAVGPPELIPVPVMVTT
jgi:hypothetical protein